MASSQVIGCDTVFIRFQDRILFGKNSDRPVGEVQVVKCGNNHFGSQLCWSEQPCYEWSFNRCGLIIGNEALPTTLVPNEGRRMLGMEILAAASSETTAKGAVECIEHLVKSKGQGKMHDFPHRTYDNAFLVCGPKLSEDEGVVAFEVFHVECYGEECQVRLVEDPFFAISNVCLSKQFQSVWGPEGSGGVRRQRSTQLLQSTYESTHGDARSMMTLLRDHHPLQIPYDEHGPISLCLHGDKDWGNTASSLVADIPLDSSRRIVCFVSYGNPCRSLYIPIFPESASVPVDMSDTGPNGLFSLVSQYKGPVEPLQVLEGLMYQAAMDLASDKSATLVHLEELTAKCVTAASLLLRHTLIVATWNSCCKRLGVSFFSSQKWLSTLCSLYQEPARFYHTLQHIHDLIEGAGNDASDAVLMTIFFHDIIYNPKSKTNEEDSASLWKQFADECKLADDTFVMNVYDWILQTAHHMDCNSKDAPHDKLFFLDLDLSILGAANPRYDEYSVNIRKEYAHVPDDLFRKGRSAILQKFLQADHLFFTEEMRLRYEESARSNIRREITALGGEADVAHK